MMSRFGPHGRPEGRLARMEAACRAGLPALAAIFLQFLLAAPLGLPAQPQLQWGSGFALVFFWTIARPWSLPPLAVLSIGLTLDLLQAGPFGLGMLLLLLVQASGLGLRPLLVRHGNGPAVAGGMAGWLAFLGVAVSAVLLQWALVSVLQWHRMPLRAAGFELLLAGGVYPLVGLASGWAARRLSAGDLA